MRTYAKELVSLQPDLILTDFNTGNRCCKTRDYHYPHCFCGSRRPGRPRISQVSPALAETSLGSVRWKEPLLVSG